MGDADAALRIYSKAVDYIAAAGLLEEVRWQREADITRFSESDLLRETAWVILCSGFREATVRRAFNHISLCFCDWESAQAIVESAPICGVTALASFKNVMKIAAIIEVAHRVHEEGFAAIKESVVRNPIDTLGQFPFIGPITVWHLAKNLGLDAVKPDRHLVRISEALGFAEPSDLCSLIADRYGEPVKVVDLTIWRYMADNPDQWRASIVG